MRNILIAMMLVSVIAGFAVAESKYVAGATDAGAAVTFKARDNGWVIKSVSAVTGADDKSVNIYARKDQALNPMAVTARSGATCTVVNTSSIITTNDLVVYQSVNGTAEYRTVSAASATSLTLSSAPSTTYGSGDKIYEIGQIGALNIGITNTAGKAVLIEAGDAIAVTPKNSPLYVINAGSTNNVLTVTAE